MTQFFFRKVNTDGAKQHLQNDLDKLVKWSEKRHVSSDFFKRHILLSRSKTTPASIYGVVFYLLNRICRLKKNLKKSFV